MKRSIKMVAAVILVVGLGAAAAHSGLFTNEHIGGGTAFAALHGQSASEQGGDPSPAVSLMQTDTALCDQPYFIAVYELSADYFSRGIENVELQEFETLMFGHARESGFFTEEEAEGWIQHIAAIPGQLIQIYRDDPTVLDTCFNFQVAAVGPPA